MKTNLVTLFDDAMRLCESTDAFYYVDHVNDSDEYRVFTYRLASFTDFQNQNALEMRGHTFKKTSTGWQLVSLPSQKFFNFSEHVGWKTEMDLNTVVSIMDKLDGSLISTVSNLNGGFFLKSKTSFSSEHAKAATAWLLSAENTGFYDSIAWLVINGWTVNFEWCSRLQQIVIGYEKDALTVLNVRNTKTGEYMPRSDMVGYFGEENIVKVFDVPADMEQWLKEAESHTGIEGYVICFNDGMWVKHKTDAYCILHKLKDSINNERRLWEACINETADDLRALFVDDPISIAKIIDMEEKAAKVYNHSHKLVTEFYNENNDLDRKSYAILAKSELSSDGTFSLAMNMYLGKDSKLKEFLIKNFKKYGIEDTEHE